MDASGTRNSSPARRDDLTDMAYIDPSLLRLRTNQSRSSSSPPSYESVATGSENRVLAYFSLPSARPKAELAGVTPPSETAVLLDYRTDSATSSGVPRPDGARFEEILLALLKFSTWKANTYTGILKLTGWTIDRARTRFAYAYEIPRPIETNDEHPVELQPRSLLSFLQNGGDADANNIPSLENRYRLALNIALSLMRLHEVNVTHRNVNSGNILFFVEKGQQSRAERIWKGPVLRKPYLTGLHQLTNGNATYDRDSPFSGIYYHPSLTGPIQIPYDLVHDYYSLGLILLEIGLWMPIGKFWKSKYTIGDFKSRLSDIYMRKLSAKCGDAYMQAVLYCMTAADETAHVWEGQPSDDQQYATAFQQNVVRALERCCRIDGDVKSHEIIEAFAGDLPPEQEAALEADTADTPSKETIKQSETVKASDAKADTTLTPKKNKTKVWSHEVPDLYTKYWNETMLPKLERILRKALSRWESYTIDLFMAGEHPDTARPTIFIECASTAKVRKILRHLNKDLRLFDIKVVSGQITRSKAAKKKTKRSKAPAGTQSAGAPFEDLNPCWQPKPGCGASIGAYMNGSHLPPVTFGGSVLVNGVPYGMSVHHMLEDDEDMQLGLDDALTMHRSMAPPATATKGNNDLQSLQAQFQDLYPFEVSEPPETEEASSTGYAYSDVSGSGYPDNAYQEAPYPFELPDEEDDPTFDESLIDDDLDNDFWLDPNFDAADSLSDDEDELDMGDTDGIHPGKGTEFLVTQPALDDVREGFFPSPEDAAAEHLCSHGLGYIHASSGLRRARSNALIHEIDWALIKINPYRLAELSDISNRPHSPVALECPPPTSILPSDALGARSVHSHARSSGLFSRGTILPSMRLVRMPGRISPSHSWQVRGNFGGGGDSGAWVFDDATGAVCGHVLAYSERSGVAYIAPMDVMINDMEKVLGQQIQLPGAIVAGSRGPASIRRTDTASPICPTSPPVLPQSMDGTAKNKSSKREQSHRSSLTVSAVM